MTFPIPFRHAALVAVAAFAILPTALAAQGPTAMVTTATPSVQELSRVSLSGNYLAARHAGLQRDIGAAAAYYRAALAWETTLWPRGEGSVYHLLVDAGTGALLYRKSYTHAARGLVYDRDAPQDGISSTRP